MNEDFAFPSETGSSSGRRGMTMREWYAGLAMAGMIAQGQQYDFAVVNAFVVADKMIVESTKEKRA